MATYYISRAFLHIFINKCFDFTSTFSAVYSIIRVFFILLSLRQGTLRGRNVGWVSFVSGISPVLLMSFFFFSLLFVLCAAAAAACVYNSIFTLHGEQWRWMGCVCSKKTASAAAHLFLLEGRP